MKTRRFVIRLGLGIIAALLGLAALVWLTGWKNPPEYSGFEPIDLSVPVMTDAEYSQVIETHCRPYIYEISSGAGAVLVFGAEHTRDPRNPQIGLISESWARFQPAVALVEGRMGFLPAAFVDPVKQFGESGAVYGLARRHRVEIYTWEQPLEAELAFVLGEFPPEQVALFYVLRPYFGNLRFGKPADPERFVEEYLRKRTRWPGLEGTLPDMGAIDAVWRRDFAGLLDWRDESDEDGLPGYLGAIARRAGIARDAHLVQAIIHLVKSGRRVFVTAGSAHAVKIEAALRAALQVK
ncbi:MAG: hypothetical protein NTZ26_11325 [Candidatus Aminicenantes bacterium]|nr:hypothetical protein [Candidatus Aminicenantes bacterium]